MGDLDLFEPQAAHIVVTAGGTREAIDDIRHVTNVSSGRFGIQIAELCTQAEDHSVELLASHKARKVIGLSGFVDGAKRNIGRSEAGITVSAFDSFADLHTLVRGACPDILFMAAAPCDYSPEKSEGKISSDPDEITLTLKRNPKLLSQMRGWYGRECFIVGFKLLSNVSRRELITAAKKQLQSCRTNLCVANDLQHVKDGQHPIIVVTPEGGVIDMTGTKYEVAQQLVEFVLRRHHVRWARSERCLPYHDSMYATDQFSRASDLLKYAQTTGLLLDHNGNISVRDNISFWITPRGLDKSDLLPKNLVHVTPDLDDRNMRFSTNSLPESSAYKPSIDSHVHALLYRDHPDIEAIIHTHDCMMISDALTSFPYPCGTKDEAEEISLAVTKQNLERLKQHDFDPPLQGYGVRLVEHGFLLMIPDLDEFLAHWDRVCQDYYQHLHDVGESDAVASLQGDDGRYFLTPLFVGSEAIGVRLTSVDFGFVSVWVHPDYRSEGYGERFVRMLDLKGLRVGVLDDCEVRAYYEARGWRVDSEDDTLTILTPPSKRDGVIEAASVVMYCVSTHSILLGERLVGSWKGYYSFPGGKIEDGETAWHTAFRELGEETGIDHLMHDVSGTNDSVTITIADSQGRVYRVHNFLGLTNREIPVVDTQEMKPLWIKLEDALELKIAHGTKYILSGLKKRLRETF